MLKRALPLLLAFVGCSPVPSAGPDAGSPTAGSTSTTGSSGSTGHSGSSGGTGTSGSSGAASTSGGSGSSGTSAGLPDGGSGSATVVVHYDVGFGHKISLRGSSAPLDWNTGLEATWNAGNTWVATLDLASEVELKPLVDDTKWAVGPNWHLAPGQTLDVWPFFDHQTGAVSKWGDWQNTALNNTRPVWIYLPPSYDENAAERYPVVYMHDGQNLFDDSTSFGGVSWNVQGAMDQGALDGSIHEAIIVGIGNTSARIDEYTPVADPQYGGGHGDTYLQAIAQDLKPQIDGSLRTLTDSHHTAIVGSSLGGLISAYAGDQYPGTFGLIGALSPSTWWDGTWIIQTTAATAGAPVHPDRVYLDSGDSGDSNDDVTNTAHLAQTYQGLGLPLDYWVQQGGQHSEYYWRQRIGEGLGFLLGPR